MPATTYFRGLILGHALLQQPYSIQDWYVGLWINDPTATGSMTGEVAAADYDRKPVLWSTSYVNSNLITWAAPVNNWGDITYVAVLNSPNPKSGNMLGYEPVGPFSMPVGQPAKIEPGNLAMTI